MTYQLAENTTHSPEKTAESAERQVGFFSSLAKALLAVVSFKFFLALKIGADVYQGAVAKLAEGGMVEQALAHLVKLDGVSIALINLLS